MKVKKKKGQPSKSPLPPPNPTSRRRNPNNYSPTPQPDFDDDDNELTEENLKIVVRLPQIDSCSGSGSGSESDPESGDRHMNAKKRKIHCDGHGSDGGISDQDKEIIKGANTSLHGLPLESGPTTPLPEKKVLVFILDRLQKKDTRGVFSEAVDPNELPDYFEIIDQPMDFGTVRKKLDDGAYKNLEELEVDVHLICSNAMQYNSTGTIYHRQARTIQDLAKRDFNNLKHEVDNGKLQPKVIRRGRPPNSKNQKKSQETTSSPALCVDNELSSGATLAKEEVKATGSNTYNLRKGPTLFRVRPTDPMMSYGSRNGENHSEWSVDWNNEFPASILRADMKYGKKQFTVDENRRDTYTKMGNNSLLLSNPIGNMKRLVPVGLQEALTYARSLARYASNISPVAWKMASRKIELVLPSGVQYGPGWVGENDSLSETTSSFSMENQKLSLSKLPTPGKLNSTTNGINRVIGYVDSSAKPVKAEPRNDFSPSHLPPANHIESSRNSLLPPPGLSGAPDLNGRVLASSPSSSLQIGSTRPDLALQL